MKYFVIFAFLLSTLALLSRAQQDRSPISCEADFDLPADQKCTPCQQALHKYNVNISSSNEPSDKCLITNVFSYNVDKTIPDSVTDVSAINKDTLDVAGKTCSDTSQCTEPYAKSAYTEVDKSCTAELTQHQSGNISIIGFRAESTIITYYTAIPFRGFFCSNAIKDCISTSAISLLKYGFSDVSDMECNDCTKEF